MKQTRNKSTDGRAGYLAGTPNNLKRLRLAIDPAQPWSQKRLAEWIAAHPVPDSDIKTQRSIEALEQGYRLKSADALEEYLKKLIQSRRK